MVENQVKDAEFEVVAQEGEITPENIGLTEAYLFLVSVRIKQNNTIVSHTVAANKIADVNEVYEQFKQYENLNTFITVDPITVDGQAQLFFKVPEAVQAEGVPTEAPAAQ